ncbi:DoxX family protein [Streptomyces sp. MS19]|uniref:DoxX family protein n=1 Tax=Streptomyces sp. MS19 TaxID=3385972 RepID=UPI0039A2EF9E
MNTALWTVAWLLSVAYLFSGSTKLLIPHGKLGGMNDASRWATEFRPGTVKAIGALEVLGAAGLVVPALLDIAPGLVPSAALGLAVIMAGATALRIRRHELTYMLIDAAYLALALFVAIGRFGPEPLTG